MTTHQRTTPAHREIPFVLQARGLQLTKHHQRAVPRILKSALGRFARRVRKVQVLLEDTNGPRGGVDTRCRLALELRPKGMFTVSAHATDALTAAAMAANRARAWVDRRAKKVRALRRQKVPT